MPLSFESSKILRNLTHSTLGMTESFTKMSFIEGEPFLRLKKTIFLDF